MTGTLIRMQMFIAGVILGWLGIGIAIAHACGFRTRISYVYGLTLPPLLLLLSVSSVVVLGNLAPGLMSGEMDVTPEDLGHAVLLPIGYLLAKSWRDFLRRLDGTPGRVGHAAGHPRRSRIG